MICVPQLFKGNELLCETLIYDETTEYTAARRKKKNTQKYLHSNGYMIHNYNVSSASHFSAQTNHRKLFQNNRLECRADNDFN